MLQFPAITRTLSHPIIARAVISADVLNVGKEHAFPQPVIPLLERNRSRRHLSKGAVCLIIEWRHHPGGNSVGGSVPCHSSAYLAVALVGIHNVGHSQGPLIRHARNSPSLFLDNLEGRHQDSQQDGDDRNHNQQLDECEATSLVHVFISFVFSQMHRDLSTIVFDEVVGHGKLRAEQQRFLPNFFNNRFIIDIFGDFIDQAGDFSGLIFFHAPCRNRRRT